MHILYLFDIDNYGNSFKTVRYCFNLHALNISIELILATASFFSFIINDLHIALFLPKNISIQLPLEHLRSHHNYKAYLSNVYYYMSPVYYYSSNANTVIELVSQKLSFRSLSYLKSKPKNSPSISSHMISLFQEMQKLPFVAKIATVPISNPSSSAPFVVSSESDPFCNYFSIKSVIKSFRNSPNFFRFYHRQLNSTIYDDTVNNAHGKSVNKTSQTNANIDLINDEYEDDKDQKICKVEESFFYFDPLKSRFTKINETEFNTTIKSKSASKSTKKSEPKLCKPKSDTLFISFLFYSNFVSSFHAKSSNGLFTDLNNLINFEIVIIITVLFYIGLRLYLLISNCINYKESQKGWKSLILLPNASTIDLSRCQSTCIICRNKMTTKTAKRLRCHHCIHLTCLVKWTKLRNRCPLCQEEIIMSQEGNGHYSYFYSYNRNIFNHSVNKNRKKKTKLIDDLIDFVIRKNNIIKAVPMNDNDGIGRNSDEDEQNVSPYLLFYVCSLRKFRFLKRHLVIINRKCSSNVIYFIEKKKNHLNNNKRSIKGENIIELVNDRKSTETPNNEIIISKDSNLWNLLHDMHYDNENIRRNNGTDNEKIVNINENSNEANNNDNEFNIEVIDQNVNENATKNKYHEIDSSDDKNMALINNNNNNNNGNLIIFHDVENEFDNDNNNKIANNDVIENGNGDEMEIINLDETNNNENLINNDNAPNNAAFNNENIIFEFNSLNLNDNNFQLYENSLSKNNFINNQDEKDEELAAKRLVSQYKSRFEFDRALLDTVYHEMINNFPFLLKEESFLANQQKELQKVRGISNEEIDENKRISQKVSLLIRKYRAAFKEMEDRKPWTIFSDPFDEIQ